MTQEKADVIGVSMLLVDSACPIINLKQSADTQAIYIDQRVLGYQAIHIDTSAYGQSITNCGTGYGLRVNEAGNGIAVDINKSATGSGNCVDIDNAGTGYSIYVKQDGAANAIVIDKVHTNNNDVIVINNSGSGYDIKGHNSNWYVDKNGNAKFNNVIGCKVLAGVWQSGSYTANLTGESCGMEDTGAEELLMPYDGSIVAISCICEDPITDGTVTIRPDINGTSQTALNCVLNTTYSERNYITISPDTVTFSAGDRMGVNFDTSADAEPVSNALVVYVWAIFD